MNLSFGRFVEMPADLSCWVGISDKEIFFIWNWKRAIGDEA
jgi:hypothetical protein